MRRKTRARIDADRVPAECPRRRTERLPRVDGTDDDESRRRTVDIGEHTRPFDLDQPAPANLGRQGGHRGRGVSDRLAAVDPNEQLSADIRPFDDREEHSALVALRDLEERLGERHSSNSMKTSISPPQGNPTPSA